MFEIYGRNNCIWCDRAKELLDRNGFAFEFYNIETDPSYLAEFKRLFPGAKSVPQIVYLDSQDNWKHIGGYTDLVEYIGT